MNRRNVLVGLGGLVAGGGALLGTGAFTTVEAERTMAIETAGDAGAFLGLQIRDDLAGGGDQISLDFDNAGEGAEGFNVNARTVLDKVLLVQNNGTQEGIEIDFDFEMEDVDNPEEIFKLESNNDGEFDDGGDGVGDLVEEPIGPGDATAFDLELELRESVLEGDAKTWIEDIDADEEFDVTVTIIAEQQE